MNELKFSLGTAHPQPVSQADNQRLHRYHLDWRSNYLKRSRQVAGGQYVDYQNQQTTCSEAQGYGMLASVYWSSFQPDVARQDFDALNHYRKQYPSEIDPRLMAWFLDDKLAKQEGTTGATDGDLDIAYALVLAAYRWQAPVYLAEAWQLLAGIEASLIREDGSLRRGDWDVNQHAVRLSDIMPTHFAAFAKVSNRALWDQVRVVQYRIMQEVTGGEGVFPDFVLKGKRGWEPAPPQLLESQFDGMMYYNACRVPWRLAAAALENNDPQASQLLQLFNQGIGQVANDAFKAGYTMQGECLNEWVDGAFSAPHMCSLLVNRRKHDLELAKSGQFCSQEGYFQDSIRLLSLYLVTGNTFTLS